MTLFGGMYAGKKILVTGHTGFKGSWLTTWLLSLGAQVAGFALSVPTTPANFSVLNLAKRITHIEGDIRDREAVTRAVQDFAPDAVFHLAAQALVRESYRDPAYTFEANAMGTLNVLEAVRATPSVQAVILITSDKAYRNDEWVWGYRETDHLGGEDPYSASKGCAEIIAHSYMRSLFTSGQRCATTRAGNVIGGGDWAADRIVPDCARAWAQNEPVSIRSPWATRPWQHVLEPLSGYLWLGAKLLENASYPFPLDKESFNFGPPADVNNSVAEVVEALAGYWNGFSSIMDTSGCAGMKECTLLKLCCDKALAHLQWHAVMPFSETIRFTAEWYRSYYAADSTSEGMFSFTMGQIEEYTAKARSQGLAWAL